MTNDQLKQHPLVRLALCRKARHIFVAVGTLFAVCPVMNVKTLKKLSWWQKTRLTAFAFSLAGLVTVVAVGMLSLASETNSDIRHLAWVSQTALPLLTVVVIAGFTKIQRTIDLRNSGDSPSADIAAARERRK